MHVTASDLFFLQAKAKKEEEKKVSYIAHTPAAVQQVINSPALLQVKLVIVGGKELVDIEDSSDDCEMLD